MDTKQKVEKALNEAFEDAYIRLEDDDGISGFVVSSQFENMSPLDRQALIDDTLEKAKGILDAEDIRQVVMIAGLTSGEFDSVGPRVRVHRVKETANGTMEVLVQGRLSDAEYVRGALNNLRGVQTTDPQPSSGGVGMSMYFQATGSRSNPLTRSKVLRALKADPYIEIVPEA